MQFRHSFVKVAIDGLFRKIAIFSGNPSKKRIRRRCLIFNQLYLKFKGSKSIARRPHNAPPTRATGPRVNDDIRDPEIRLIGPEGENVGVVSPQVGMDMAAEAGLDLVEISPNAKPPVCKVMDYGKFKYEQAKRESEAKKKQKTIEIKEIKFRPNTDTHDYDVKMRNIRKFLEDGNKVKVTLRFRGREMAHQQLGLQLLHRVRKDVEDIGTVETMPKLEGRQMMMMVNPAKTIAKPTEKKVEENTVETKDETAEEPNS